MPPRPHEPKPHADRRLGATQRQHPACTAAYEELGLLPAPARQGKYRVYNATHLDVVRLIREAQALGFKLQELQDMAREMPLIQALHADLALPALLEKRQALVQQIQAMQARVQTLDLCIGALGAPRLHAALCEQQPAPAQAAQAPALRA